MKLLNTYKANLTQLDLEVITRDLENEIIIKKTFKWKIEKAKKWFYVWWNVKIFWYNKVKIDWWIILEIDDTEKEIVKRIFNMFIVKMYNREEIKNILEKENVDLWTHNWKIYTSSISRILRNDIYTWIYYIWKKYSFINLENNEFTCPKIIDEDIYQEAQEIFLKDNLKFLEN